VVDRSIGWYRFRTNRGLTDDDVKVAPEANSHPPQNHQRGANWHFRGALAGRRLRGSTGTASKEIAQRIAAGPWGPAVNGHPDGPATFAQAAMLYRAADKSDRVLRPIEILQRYARKGDHSGGHWSKRDHTLSKRAAGYAEDSDRTVKRVCCAA
jgi:hypothetical protein